VSAWAANGAYSVIAGMVTKLGARPHHPDRRGLAERARFVASSKARAIVSPARLQEDEEWPHC